MKRDELAMEVVLTAGKLMIESGADMARVDDTMYRLAKMPESKSRAFLKRRRES